VGRISILCGPAVLPDSYSRSKVASLAVDFPATITCDVTDTIVFGFKYIYSNSLKDCELPQSGINTMCVSGSTSCSAAPLSENCINGPMSVVMVMCAPAGYGSMISQYGSLTYTGGKDVIACPEPDAESAGAFSLNDTKASTLLFGSSLIVSDDYEVVQAEGLQSASIICDFGESSCDVPRDPSLGGQRVVDIAVCIPPLLQEAPPIVIPGKCVGCERVRFFSFKRKLF
jgi:hypothetical protein